MLNPLFRALALSACLVPLAGFKDVRPVEIMPEADECARCRMAVQSDRFSGEWLAANGDVLKFDDLGCMVAYVKGAGPDAPPPKGAFVHDFASGAWLPLEKAHLVRTRFETPMRYGLLAFAEPAAARALPARYKATPVTWRELLAKGARP